MHRIFLLKRGEMSLVTHPPSQKGVQIVMVSPQSIKPITPLFKK